MKTLKATEKQMNEVKEMREFMYKYLEGKDSNSVINALVQLLAHSVCSISDDEDEHARLLAQLVAHLMKTSVMIWHDASEDEDEENKTDKSKSVH